MLTFAVLSLMRIMGSMPLELQGPACPSCSDGRKSAAVARVGVSTIVNMQPDMTVVAEASNGQQAVELFRKHRPDVAVVCQAGIFLRRAQQRRPGEQEDGNGEWFLRLQ